MLPEDSLIKLCEEWITFRPYVAKWRSCKFLNEDLFRTDHFPAVSRPVHIFCRILSQDLLNTHHSLAVQISCRYLNKDLLRRYHFPAVGRQVHIFCRFLNKDLLKTNHSLAIQISYKFHRLASRILQSEKNIRVLWQSPLQAGLKVGSTNPGFVEPIFREL